MFNKPLLTRTVTVKAALEIATAHEPVTAVSDDTDILVLLVYHFKPTMADIYLITSGKNKLGLMISIRSVQKTSGSV